MDDLIERLREESQRLSGNSLDRGCAQCGIAANVADSAADRIASDAATIARLTDQLRRAEASTLIVAELCAQIPVPQILKATGTGKDLIDWFKQLRADKEAAESRLLTIKKDTVEKCAKEGEGAVRQLWGGEPCDPDEYADFVGNAILSLATPSVPGTPDIGTSSGEPAKTDG